MYDIRLNTWAFDSRISQHKHSCPIRWLKPLTKKTYLNIRFGCVCLSNRIKMSKSDIYVPSCHIYVQITLYISKVQYICPKLRYVYPNQYICPKLRYVYPNPAACFRFIYNSQMILHISIQFRYKYFTDFSRDIFHAVSISCKSTWPVPHLTSMTSRPTCEWTTLQNSNCWFSPIMWSNLKIVTIR